MSEVEETVDNEVDGEFEITPDMIQNVVYYQLLQFQPDPDGMGIMTSVIQVPVPRAVLEQFKTQFGAEMAKQNLEIVIFQGKAFLAPVKKTNLIGI